jgi:hypothetical protein
MSRLLWTLVAGLVRIWTVFLLCLDLPVNAIADYSPTCGQEALLLFALCRGPPRLASRPLKTLIGALITQYCHVAPPGDLDSSGCATVGSWP